MKSSLKSILILWIYFAIDKDGKEEGYFRAFSVGGEIMLSHQINKDNKLRSILIIQMTKYEIC